MKEIRQLPAAAPRVETGTTQFGDDWPGVFIRGDNAFAYGAALRVVLEGMTEPNPETHDPLDAMAYFYLRNLRDLLEASHV